MDTVSTNLQPYKNSFECIAKYSKIPIWRHHRLCAFLRYFVHRSVCWWTVTIICLPISCYRDNILKEVSNIMLFCDTYMHNKYVRFTAYNPICTDQHCMAIYLEWNCCPGPRATMRDKRERDILSGPVPSPINMWLWCAKQLFVWPDAFRETIIAPYIWPWLFELETCN